jgi:hypothetical protein
MYLLQELRNILHRLFKNQIRLRGWENGFQYYYL